MTPALFVRIGLRGQRAGAPRLRMAHLQLATGTGIQRRPAVQALLPATIAKRAPTTVGMMLITSGALLWRWPSA